MIGSDNKPDVLEFLRREEAIGLIARIDREHGNIKSELNDKLSVHPDTVSTLLEKASEAGLIRRGKFLPGDHGRSHRYELTTPRDEGLVYAVAPLCSPLSPRSNGGSTPSFDRDFEPRYNIAPEKGLVVVHNDDHEALTFDRWGSSQAGLTTSTTAHGRSTPMGRPSTRTTSSGRHSRSATPWSWGWVLRVARRPRRQAALGRVLLILGISAYDDE